jgi:hypothetical protein
VASVSVLHGIAAANARANLVETTQGLRRALARLSTGFHLTSERDDEAGATDSGSDDLRWSILSQSGIAEVSQARRCSSAVVPLAQ